MRVRMTVLPAAGNETGEVVLSSMDLSEELAELDGVDIHEVPREDVRGTKGAGQLAHLLAQVPAAGLATLVEYLRGWAARTQRTVEISIGDDAIKVTGTSREQQDRLIEVWVVSHTSGT